MFWYRVRQVARSVFTSFWFWPLLFIALALWLSSAVSWFAANVPVDADMASELARGAEAYATAILTTTAMANVTVLTFVFSSFMVVLQLASSQLSPRILRTIVREGSAQLSMAIMVGGFVFSLYGLLRTYEAADALAPLFLVVVALGWTSVSVLAFLRFVGYTISHIRAPAVIRSVADTTAHAINRLYLGQRPSGQASVPEYDIVAVVEARRDGIVTGLNTEDLTRWARRHHARVTLDVGLGDYVSAGVPIGRVQSERPVRTQSVTRFMVVERERTLRGDPPYGFRLLVDIANRALSPAVNDPTTAVQVLDELQSLLVLLSGRPEQPGRFYDEDGKLRLEIPTTSWRTFLNLALQEIYEFGRHSSQVTQRVERLLAELAGIVHDERLDAVREMQAAVETVSPLIPTTRALEAQAFETQ